jgi:peptidoglycan/xylan/chitin deacetylase (PgdA/CDA1 family)
MYHSVDESGSTLSVSAGDLGSHLEVLRDGGWRSLSAAEYLARLLGGSPAGAREVFLTFDDAYDNFYERAAPLFLQYGYRATVFVPTDFIGGRPEWFRRDRERITDFLTRFRFSAEDLRALDAMMASAETQRLMTAAQIMELNRAGFDFASHSAGHHFLTMLSSEELEADLRRSRQALAALGVDAAPLLCYPYGAVDQRVKRAAERLQFEAAFTATYDRGPVNDRYTIGRAGIGGEPGTFQFRFALSPALDHYVRLAR